MAYWCAARLQPHRESLALHCLSLAGFEAYYPRVADRRIRHGRRVVLTASNRVALQTTGTEAGRARKKRGR